MEEGKLSAKPSNPQLKLPKESLKLSSCKK